MRAIFGALAVLISAQILVAEDWPQWRGPDRNGISREMGWLDKWPDQGPAIAWKANVGLGFSGIVVSKGRAATVGHENETDTFFCLDAISGKQLWKHSYPAELGDKYYEGGSTGAPTFDGDRLYWLSRWGDLFCFEAASGKIVWQRQLQKEMEARVPTWGFSGAPTVHNDLLSLNVGDAGLAVNKNTGKTVWESAKKDPGYTTPLPVQRGDKTEIWIGSAKSFVSVNPADGKEIWRMRWVTQYDVTATDPIPYEDKVFISTGYGKGAALFKPAPGAEPQVIWQSKVLRTQFHPAILIGKHVYGVDGDTTDRNASVKCIEVETGKELWSEKGFGSGGLMAADGKLIILSQQGELIVAPAVPEGFKPIARAQVLGGKSWTAPTLANGIVYCRNSKGDIAAVDLRKK